MSVTCESSMVLSGSFDFLQQLNWPPRYKKYTTSTIYLSNYFSIYAVFWLKLNPLVLLLPKTLNYLAFPSFDFEHTWCSLFQKRFFYHKARPSGHETFDNNSCTHSTNIDQSEQILFCSVMIGYFLFSEYEYKLVLEILWP